MKNVCTLGALLALAACGGGIPRQERPEGMGEGERSRQMAGGTLRPDDAARCEADERIHEVSEYDTSGDEYPDVRKVFLRVGDPPAVRLVLICREADLNGDGVKDVVRYYSDEGRPLREEADRDMDGQMDEIIYFEGGRIVRIEQDTSHNGHVDTKIFYENGAPVRAERDMTGRSTADHWQPDRWEYYEGGRMVRMGNDVDGDGRVDHWDRDEALRHAADERAAQALAEEQAADQNSDEYGDTSSGDTSAPTESTLQERLQKILASAGVASRRAAEKLVTEGRVRVNGRIVRELGTKADARNDKIEVDGKRVVAEPLVYHVLNKPRAVVSTLRDPEGRDTVKELLHGIAERVFPIGRLDYHTSGALLVTNDGALAEALLVPARAVPKKYVVKVRGHLDVRELDALRNGVRLDDGYRTKKAELFVLREEPRHTWLEVTLIEGKNRQIHRMLEAVGRRVQRLSRTEFAGIGISGLAPGEHRPLTGREVEKLKKKYLAKSATGDRSSASRSRRSR